MDWPFERAWPHIALKGFRDGSTYTDFAFDQLPPIPMDQFDGSFSWLAETPLLEFDCDESPDEVPDPIGAMNLLRSTANRHGIELPVEFCHFMTRADLQGRIRSATACEFRFVESVTKIPIHSGYVVPFLSDSQGCVHWNLFLADKGQYCVVASVYDYNWQSPTDWDDETPEYFRLTEDTFEAFIYRFWIENEIWFKSSRFFPDTLTIEQESYLEHYIQFET